MKVVLRKASSEGGERESWSLSFLWLYLVLHIRVYSVMLPSPLFRSAKADLVSTSSSRSSLTSNILQIRTPEEIKQKLVPLDILLVLYFGTTYL